MMEQSPPKTELQIMTAFLLQEKKRQKHLGRLEGKTVEPRTGVKCYTCHEEGHRSADCPKKGKSGKKMTASRALASMKTAPKVCPACNTQHSFKSDKGEILYRTRLSSCLLHGTTSKFCNLAQVHASRSRGQLSPSPLTLDEVEMTENPCALMHVQWLECIGEVNHALAFWDSGSNVKLVRKKFAKMTGWEGLPVVQQLQTTGRGGED